MDDLLSVALDLGGDKFESAMIDASGAEVDRIAHEAGHSYPAFMDSDSVAITDAEKWVGAARGENTIRGMDISPGLVGGLILAVIEGRTTFGALSALEAIASGPHAAAWPLTADSRPRTVSPLCAWPPVAVDASTCSVAVVAQAVMSATALLDLDVVTIGGGFARVTPDFGSPIRR